MKTTICLRCNDTTWQTASGLCSECEPKYERKFQSLCEENGIKIDREYGGPYLTAKYWFYLGVGIDLHINEAAIWAYRHDDTGMPKDE